MYVLVSKVRFTKKWRKNSGAILSFSIRFGRVEIPDYLPKKHVQVSLSLTLVNEYTSFGNTDEA